MLRKIKNMKTKNWSGFTPEDKVKIREAFNSEYVIHTHTLTEKINRLSLKSKRMKNLCSKLIKN